MTAHLEDYNLLSLWQSGFRAGHSTTTALLQVTNDWYSALDQGLVVGVIFLDISKAFDTVSHQLLLARLREFGFDPVNCECFASYLADRHQSTCINAAQLEEVAVDRALCSVPSYSLSLSTIFQPSSKESPQSYLRTTPVYTWRAVSLMPSPAHLLVRLVPHTNGYWTAV